MNIKKKIIGLLSVTMLTFMVGCSSSESNESNVTNSNGEEVVVATSVAVTEILDKLGVEVSGVPTTSYELPENTKGLNTIFKGSAQTSYNAFYDVNNNFIKY